MYGAGSGGHLLVREMRVNRMWNLQPVAFLDDDPLKRNQLILGVPVRGNLRDLERVLRAHRLDEVIISTRKVSDKLEAEIRSVCEPAGVQVRRLWLEIR